MAKVTAEMIEAGTKVFMLHVGDSELSSYAPEMIVELILKAALPEASNDAATLVDWSRGWDAGIGRA